MRRIAILLALLVLVPRLGASPRVVLLSIDGGSDAILDRLLATGALKGGFFERTLRRGAVAESMTPAAVSSTPVSHPTLFTGTWPSTHGITGPAALGDDLDAELKSAFALPTSVPRIWSLAQQAGKRVVCIAAPGAEATSPESTCTENAPFNAIANAPAGVSKPGTPLLARMGPSPGEPGGPLVTRGEISEEEYVLREERFADYIGNAVRMELGRRDWDLLITYIPMMDGLEHRYLLTDPRQVEYGDEEGARRARFAQFIERGYRKLDAILGAWRAKSPETNFVIVSDHGMVPTHSLLLLNNALAAGGLRVSGSDAEARAVFTGGTAEVYVNARSRFAHGTVADADVPAVVAKVVDILRALRDPVTGRPILRTIASGDELGALHLRNPSAGDVYVAAEPGWAFTGRYDPAVPLIVPNTLSPDARERVSRSPAERLFLEKGANNELSAGVHGHQPGDPRTQAIFYAIGPDVPHRKLPTIDMVDVAPTVLRILGIPAPGYMNGRTVF